MSNVIYTRIENAIVARLKLGLGKLAREVNSYGGELDDDMAQVVKVLPAVWVTFGGIIATKPVSTSRTKYRTTGKYVVMLGDQNRRSEVAGRKGGPRDSEVGTYPLLYAVRRLLSGQDLSQDIGDEIDRLKPGRVRTLFNSRHSNQAFSIFAAEFECDWIEHALENNHWPAPEAIDEPDQLFVKYSGKLDVPYPDLLKVEVNPTLISPASDADDPNP